MKDYEEYTIEVETDRTASALTNDQIDTIMDGLEGYAPSVSTSPWGRVLIVMTLPSRRPGLAVDAAIDLVARVLGGASVLSVECAPSTLYDQRSMSAEKGDLSTAEAARRLGVTAQRVQQMIHEGKIPARRVGRTWAIPAAAIDKRTA